MSKSKPLPLDSQLCFALYSAERALNRLFKQLIDARGITYPQYLVLSTLWDEDNRTVSAIGERLSLEPSTITPLVKRLEKAGLVVRERNPKDERQVFVSLTATGMALQAEISCLAGVLQERTGMTAEQILSFNETVKAFRDGLMRKAVL